MKKKRLMLGGAVVCMLPLAAIAFAAAYNMFGDAGLVAGNNSPYAAEIQSECASSTPFGGVRFTVPAGLTVADLDTLSTDFQLVNSTNGGGSPRFQIRVATPNGPRNIFVYIGTPPNYTGDVQNVWTNTGNLLDAADLVDSSQLGGNFYDPYANVQANYGSYEVLSISVVADGCWVGGNNGVQTAWIDNVLINSDLTTFDQPQSANDCKNGGWQFLTRGDNTPFRNQGDCIQYFNTGR
jgi:hypothetical protein